MDVVEKVDRRPVPLARKVLYLLGAVASPAGLVTYLALTTDPGAGIGTVLALSGVAVVTLCIYGLVAGAVEAGVRSVQLRREAARSLRGGGVSTRRRRG